VGAQILNIIFFILTVDISKLQNDICRLA